MSTSHVLIVEDDDTLGMSLEMSLTSRGLDVRWVRTLVAASAAAAERKPDLVVLDLGLPDGDGLSLCRELRQRGDLTPILVLTARGTLEARVAGLDSGADDYVTKPFELPELLARVDALLRRRRWTEPASERVKVGRLTVDFESREASDTDGPVEMTELEFKLLKFFVEHRGRTVTREELLLKVWERPPDAKTRSVDVFVSRLRRRIEGHDEDQGFLIPVRGVGYRLQAPVAEVSSSSPEDDVAASPEVDDTQ